MVVKDSLGNTVHEGQTLFWASMGLVCKVSRIEKDDIIAPGRKAKATLVLEVPLPLDPTKPFQELSGFVCVVMPDEKLEKE